jgi:tellurite resistance-related uncharacterized protein
VLEAVSVPDGVQRVRSTPVFTVATLPDGLLRAHRLGAGVWGRLRVTAGSVVFVSEGDDESRRLGPGDAQVIEPEVAHHVEPGPDAEFSIEFYR